MDWILSVMTLVGLWLVGNKNNAGNILLFLSQPLWAWFAFSTNQKGLLLSAGTLLIVFGRNWWKWRGAPKLW